MTFTFSSFVISKMWPSGGSLTGKQYASYTPAGFPT